MNIAFSHRNIHFQENQNLALFFQPISTFWLYLPKKIISFLLRIKYLEILNRNYEATSLIFIMKPQAS
ncbi:hypothetical protein SAMN04488079_1025 [Methylophaga sulfidovorans]|uniref:Uncharacterized protein n=1 Tax=Methylophaga sulfidovorans TaxID=45496 RepID=A0A1I3UKU7_9GAMM|nr:hypothetical protein SAMN04488079_1025 [Methylophaga sulfidovorans]